MIRYKSQDEIRIIRRAARIVHDALLKVEEAVQPGVTLQELDAIAEDYIVSQGAIPGFKGLYDFPATLCLSPNDMVVHGIPDLTVLNEGDIIGVDCGAIVDGYYGDHAKTFAVGRISEEDQKLLDVTRESLHRGIEQCVPGNRLNDIGHAIQSFCESHGYGVVRELVGHGIGQQLHEDPQVPNYGTKGTGVELKKGMCLAIEPMINAGVKDIYTGKDGWAILTRDGKKSAHFEHTIAITANGPVVLSTAEQTVFD
jgi:methionyl aminopeptidase